jgi:acetylornithine deacetylase/succinyl-diaminopimelate desuccinylase-like protein
MAVAFRELANTGFRPKGTLIYFGVADEEAGGVYGADWVTAHHWDDVACDYVLTETGGILAETPAGPRVVLTAAEKGIGWRRLTIKGTPGHGSMPWQADNALIKAAEVVRRFHEYQPTPRITEYWTAFVESMGLDDLGRQALLDPGRVRDAIALLEPRTAKYAHACTHTTFSPNVISGGQKANMIPDTVHLEVDIRTLPGETEEDIDAHLRTALGDLYDEVTVVPIAPRAASSSPRQTPMWDVLEKRLKVVHPGAEVIPWLLVGGTDAAFFREKGAVAYGAGVFSERATLQQIQNRYHGDDERIDVGSLALQAQFWLDVARDVVG